MSQKIFNCLSMNVRMNFVGETIGGVKSAVCWKLRQRAATDVGLFHQVL